MLVHRTVLVFHGNALSLTSCPYSLRPNHDIQETTVFSSGIQVGAQQVDAANAWIKFLTAPAAAAAFKSKGLEPG